MSDSGTNVIKRTIFEAQGQRPCFIPLLPRHGLNVLAPRGEGERFARLFRETWSRIPLGARRSILRHWREPFIPSVDLVPDWSGREGATGYRAGKPVRRGRGLRGDKACCTWRGHQLRFWHPIVVTYPDNLVRDLIAHELAHVVQHALDEEFEDNFEKESDADWRVESWGFSATDMDEWDRANGLVRMIDWDTLDDRQRSRVKARMIRAGRGAVPFL